jgi:hypothetical protein
LYRKIIGFCSEIRKNINTLFGQKEEFLKMETSVLAEMSGNFIALCGLTASGDPRYGTTLFNSRH